MNRNWRKSTLCVQGGYSPKVGEPRVLPIYQSTTYKYDDPEKLAHIFDLKEEGHIYSRISNPTVSAFEEKIAQLEGGVGALATSSGQAAITLAILNICSQNEHILALSTLYGGTHTLFSATLKKLGIEVTFVEPTLSIEEILSCAKLNTKAIYAETIGNPALNVLDFEKFSSVAKKLDVPLIIDNTFATPYLCQPFKYGANIIIHSATKYIDGHANNVGGIIVDGGNFNWNNGKYPELTEPDQSYHGIKYYEEFKEKAFIAKTRSQLLRDIGCTLSPFNAFMLNIGLETLHLRMERHSENALKLAEYLDLHEKVSWVNYPGLRTHSDHKLAQKYLPNGASGILTFGLKGGKDAAKKLMTKLNLVALVVHVGDARTSILHPATTTHKQLSYEDLKKSGVSEDMIRVSVGIEAIDDIIDDFQRALNLV
ncbi:O-acetylhomoserine (thiol)-lyase [Proteiniborus sp. DW1]|uniref:O-acetylhomoserine aminocarboxypropyltransferase/cysteine synthase family protein n=1 Tax=Proteiniborus sp. DW1 TaxID=1889883 RepID=UPI00092E04AC|nr:O-acetylhomoserine aminocarboxypropyltransferase/cysteine synthase family protein [Proteiniborus sp. DW1]SCG84166.1 O-acetylhomoserine (thiol)-lyase [Proteiniborus sp. DW1]